jgi:hypothetical protein
MLDLSQQRHELELYVLRDAVDGDAPVPFAQADLQLEASQVRPEAPVDAAAEAEVAEGGPVEVDHVGPLVGRLVVFADPSSSTT